MTSSITICFRADGDSIIGLGHVVRSKALASVLEEVEHVKVIWASCDTANSSPNAVEKLYGRSMVDNVDLKLPHGSVCNIEEAKTVGLWAKHSKANWIIIDHYKINEEYLCYLYNTMNDGSDTEIKIMIMDDHQVRVSHVAMRLAPMQVFTDNLNNNNNNVNDCNVVNLIGPQYLLLRPDFAKVATQIKEKQSSNNHNNTCRSGTIICFGGADTLGMTSKCIDMLLDTTGTFFNQRRGEKLYILASDKMCDAQNLQVSMKRWSSQLGENTIERKSWVDANEMATLLSSCSYAFVSASGVGVETVAMKCPCTVLCWVDNQMNHAKIIKGLSGGCVAKNIEEIKIQLSDTDVGNGSKIDANGDNDMETMNRLHGTTIDPYGAWRVASKLLGINLLKDDAL
jgi:UDP-2,4-diacetamido-2,4,6-trideoxy-beta-L-altropyranose hydrolase